MAMRFLVLRRALRNKRCDWHTKQIVIAYIPGTGAVSHLMSAFSATQQRLRDHLVVIFSTGPAQCTSALIVRTSGVRQSSREGSLLQHGWQYPILPSGDTSQLFLTGSLGFAGSFTGLVIRLSTSCTALSSCGSRPANTERGSFSTSISGSTP